MTLQQPTLFEMVRPYVPDKPNFVMFGPLVLLPDVRALFLDRERIFLRPREYDLLVFMLERPMRIFSRRFLLQYVWGLNSACNTNTVDVHMSTLRRKLKPYGLHTIIESVYGVGYSCNLK